MILNLFLNARDALEEVEEDRNSQIVVGIEKVERAGVAYACVSVRDNGIGMSEAVQQHIFFLGFTRYWFARH